MFTAFSKATRSILPRFQPNWQMRLFSTQLAQSENNRRIMQSQIRESLAKLEQLSNLIPEEDPRTIKARKDFEELHEQFGQILFQEGEGDQGALSDNEEVTEAHLENQSQKEEMQTKKLMTVVKSKYYMLKANFPKQAL